MTNNSSLKIAIVHDWLVSLGGAERVLIELSRIFPDAPIYTLFAQKSFIRDYFPSSSIRTSFLQSFPFINSAYRYYVSLMPTAIESLDLSGFDLVISSSAVFSKGLILRPQTKHICYCYSPSRFLWDRHAQYESRSASSFLIRHYLRLWDRPAADRADKFIAISEHVKKRIFKYYRRESKVIYPPVRKPQETTYSISDLKPHSYYLVVSRLFPHKNIDITIEAFNKLKKPLIIIGQGPQMKKLSRLAGPHIKLLGWQPDEIRDFYYENCRAFIMPQEEDFGLTPVEAMNYGRPVLALRQGGALEIVKEGITGEFFDDPIPEGLADGVRRLELNYPNYQPSLIKFHTQQFSVENFQREIQNIIIEIISNSTTNIQT